VILNLTRPLARRFLSYSETTIGLTRSAVPPFSLPQSPKECHPPVLLLRCARSFFRPKGDGICQDAPLPFWQGHSSPPFLPCRDILHTLKELMEFIGSLRLWKPKPQPTKPPHKKTKPPPTKPQQKKKTKTTPKQNNQKKHHPTHPNPPSPGAGGGGLCWVAPPKNTTRTPTTPSKQPTLGGGWGGGGLVLVGVGKNFVRDRSFYLPGDLLSKTPPTRFMTVDSPSGPSFPFKKSLVDFSVPPFVPGSSPVVFVADSPFVVLDVSCVSFLYKALFLSVDETSFSFSALRPSLSFLLFAHRYTRKRSAGHL